MKAYKRLIRPMMLVPASSNDYGPKLVPIEPEEKWYPEENRETLATKYRHFETTCETLVFDAKYEEVEIPKIVRCIDCKHFHIEVKDEFTTFFGCNEKHHPWGENWFCADGKRRDDDG